MGSWEKIDDINTLSRTYCMDIGWGRFEVEVHTGRDTEGLSMLNVAQGANFVSRYDLCISKPHHDEEIHEQGVF